jgi:iron complex outermembrane receptor protein
MTQGRARFSGLELDTRWHLHRGELHSLDLRVAADLVRATGEEGPLPRIPPARTTLGMEWRHGPWGASLDWRHDFAQRRVAVNEEPSPSHELVSASLTHCLKVGKLEADLFLRGSNLLDREVRPHTSFLRDLAPLPGRSLSSGVTLRF